MPSKLHPPKFYYELSGISADSIIMAIRSSELIASDMRRAGGKRPRWYISEDAWQAWLDSRSNLEADPVANRKTITVRQYV